MRQAANAAEARVAAIERLRAAGLTAAAACAELGMSAASYYRARRRSGQARRAGRVQIPARPARLQPPPAHWPVAGAWLRLAPPWSVLGATGFSPYAVLKPVVRRLPARRPANAQPIISPFPAPVVDRTNAAPSAPLRLRASLEHRPARAWGGALNGLAELPALLGKAAPLLALTAAAALFGMALTTTAANPAAMHLSDAAAQARLVATGE
jgi:hypothetical protein